MLVEPGQCPDSYTEPQIKALASVPILVVFGDHRATPTGVGPATEGHFWQRSFESCEALIGRVKAAGGNAQMLNPPDRGIRGNSHMIMRFTALRDVEQSGWANVAEITVLPTAGQ